MDPICYNTDLTGKIHVPTNALVRDYYMRTIPQEGNNVQSCKNSLKVHGWDVVGPEVGWNATVLSLTGNVIKLSSKYTHRLVVLSPLVGKTKLPFEVGSSQ